MTAKYGDVHGPLARPCCSEDAHRAGQQHAGHLRGPVVAGLIGAAALVAVYLSIVAGTSRSLSHALELLSQDRFYVAAIAAGFGIQMGLYVHLREQRRRLHGLGASTALTATGTGTSTGAMVVCCLHHVADVLPLAGLSGAAIFLSQYRIEIMLAGLLGNAAGIAFSLRLLWRMHRALGSADRTEEGLTLSS